ncbi:hypothetical protein [Actibacterium ureilyticum]|uniref:hypothetical protein n=1 Tax=Actibacterium ureilyticum TaxID=1590614 RepID=UPI000BAADEA8|nr:hypothetical protein [Actibacterium ureilyticum]
MTAQKRWLITTGLTLVGALTFVGARAQENAADAGAGVEVTVDVKSTLRFTDNYENEQNPDSGTTFLRTDLGFGVLSETRSQRFEFNLRGQVDAGDFPQSDGFETSLENRSADLAYQHETRDTRLRFNARTRRTEVRDTAISPEFDLRDTFAGTGTLDVNRLAFDIETGRSAPFGLKFGTSLRERNYSDVSSDNLFDSDTVDLDLSARFDLSPTLSVSPFVGLSEYDAEDLPETERDRTNVGLRVDHEIAPGLSFDGQVSFDRVETTETVGGERRTTETDGPSARLGIKTDRANGTIGARYSTRISAAGRRDTIWVDRTLDLPDGSFGLSLGLTDSEETDTRALAALRYDRELRTGAISASLAQSADTALEDDDEVLRTRVEFNYDYQINADSTIRAGVDFAHIDGLSDNATDSQRARLNVSYNHGLSNDWDLTTGFEHSYSKRDNSSDRTTNTVFMGLERSFSFRP